MEEYKTLLEIVTELLDKGYLIDFSSLENIVNDYQKTHSLNIQAKDFLIDEIHFCENEGDNLAATYVIAISSKKYKFKGIVINTLIDENLYSISTALIKIKKQILKKIYLFKNRIIKANTH